MADGPVAEALLRRLDAADGGLDSAELAAALGVEHQAVVGAVKSLQALGEVSGPPRGGTGSALTRGSWCLQADALGPRSGDLSVRLRGAGGRPERTRAGRTAVLTREPSSRGSAALGRGLLRRRRRGLRSKWGGGGCSRTRVR